MTGNPEVLEILVVDDDREVIGQLKELLPGEIAGYSIVYECTSSFDDALRLLKLRRFDLLVSDVYVGRDTTQKNIHAGHVRAKELVEQIRQTRICPVVLFTDGQIPPDLVKPPFVWSADKAGGAFEHLVERIEEALQTGLPAIARRLHDELDRFAGSYVWSFLEGTWGQLKDQHGIDPAMIERIIRRRAAIQLGRLDDRATTHTERQNADPVDYYIYPPIVDEVRLGEILLRKTSSEFRVVLTPHCFLVMQPGETACRADHVLTARLVPVAELSGVWKWQNGDKRQDDLRRRMAIPAGKAGQPEGRYCFLPGFLRIPDLYCDLFRLESLPYDSIENDYERIAVLDLPYAEAIQAAMARLYGSVGLPILNPALMTQLLPKPT